MSQSQSEARADHETGRQSFPVTRWSAVLAAREGDPDRAAAALEDLCQAYWFPIYVYVRRCGFAPADAEDITQGYFAALLERNYFAQADAAKGKLRSFLLTTVKHFIADERSKAAALKRGHGKSIISLDAAQAEERYRFEPTDEASPDKLYEKRWALTLLDNVLNALRADYARGGQGRIFDALQPFLAWNSGNESYREVAAALGIKETAVRVAIFRLRRRYGDLLRAQITDTVASPEDVPAELDHLFSLLR
jgi:RNA polymerase sigma-70 factor (ECF subfamily)